jgi:excisionase family DNA binding protein
MNEPVWLTIEQAAERLGVEVAAVRKGMKSGAVPFAKVGRLIRISVTWVTAALDRAAVLGVSPLDDLGKDREPEDDTLDEALRRMDPRVVLQLVSYDWLVEVGLRPDEAYELRRDWRIAGHALDIDPTEGRPPRVPDRARKRYISTAAGRIPIWYWTTKAGWSSKVGGPQPSSMLSGSSMMDTIRMAGDYARRTYGKRIRRTSIRLRFSVLQRDGFTCRYCGRKAPDVELRVDHIVPVAQGGTDHPDNLCAACTDCNAGKADLLL